MAARRAQDALRGHRNTIPHGVVSVGKAFLLEHWEPQPFSDPRHHTIVEDRVARAGIRGGIAQSHNFECRNPPATASLQRERILSIRQSLALIGGVFKSCRILVVRTRIASISSPEILQFDPGQQITHKVIRHRIQTPGWWFAHYRPSCQDHPPIPDPRCSGRVLFIPNDTTNLSADDLLRP